VTALAVSTRATSLAEALSLGGSALALCRDRNVPALVSAACEADALVLGKLQREDTLRERSPARFSSVVRRTTTGTESQLCGAVLYHALALPRVDALFPDASARTLLNRNLRALLRGYAAAGVPLRYFGTEVLALLGHPVALVGYDQLESGAVLIEVLVGLQQPCVVRPALKREPPAALYQLLRSSPEPEALLEKVVAGVVERLGVSPLEVDLPAPAPLAELSALGPAASVVIPLGTLEASWEPVARITGDLLVGTAALSRVEALAQRALVTGAPLDASVLEPLKGAPLDGARPGDLLQALSLSLG
jgi:hypothetical protein